VTSRRRPDYLEAAYELLVQLYTDNTSILKIDTGNTVQPNVHPIPTQIVVERVTVVKFRVDNRGSDGTGCFRIEVGTDTAKLTNMRITGLRK